MNKNTPLLITAAILVQTAIGAGSGALAGYYVSKNSAPAAPSPAVLVVPGATNTTPLIPEPVAATSVRLVPLSMVEPVSRTVPDDLRNRRSPLAVLMVAKRIGTVETYKTLGRAVAVTSDGWFIAPQDIIQTNKSADLRLAFENRLLAVESGVLDDSSGIAYLKSSARDLPTTAFAKNLDDKVGYMLWHEIDPKAYISSSLVSVNQELEAVAHAGDKPVRRFLAGGNLTATEIGSPLWDSSGSLLGLALTSTEGRLALIPASLISSSLQSLINDGSVSHATMGVTYINLARVLGTENSKGLQIRAIGKGSAAEKAGLKINDVILEVEHDIIDTSSELGDILAEYRPGATVTLRVLREKSETDLTITLGSQVTSRPLP